MIHGTCESDMTSIGLSSSSPMAAYYVQSPSRDSRDEIDYKCSSSNSHSPSRSPCSYPRHSMASSSSTMASRIFGNKRRWNKHYCNVVAEEEGTTTVYNEEDDGAYSSGLCRCLILVFAFGMVFAGICLVFSVAGRPYKPRVRVKSLRVQNLLVGEGSDHTGVPTELISVNCSANLVIYNPAAFFGIHVGSKNANLIYSQIAVATGQLKKCYLPKKSMRIMWVRLIGHEVPIYGAGMELAATSDDESGDIPFKLEFEIQSRGYMVGILVKTEHTIHASCLLFINPNKHTKDISLGLSSCKYI